MANLRVRLALLPAIGCIAMGCGGSALTLGETSDSGGSSREDAGGGAPPPEDAGLASPPPDATVPTACVPGVSVACVGSGGCASNQVCNADGTGFGPCDCATTPTDAAATLCVPGESIACAGAGGCISSQVCDDAGTGYGACVCEGDAAGLLCIPGQSIACSGPYGCPSFQVCNASGSAYGACDCPEGGTGDSGDGGLPDGYAPLPPPVGDQGYNAILGPAPSLPGAAPVSIYLPLFSAPDCRVVPPYGQAYLVYFEPADTDPSGTLPACLSGAGVSAVPCYFPSVAANGVIDSETVPGGVYTLSAFDANGIARGQMNTNEGIVPLVVKSCL
jgi:hypothetical protein